MQSYLTLFILLFKSINAIFPANCLLLWHIFRKMQMQILKKDIYDAKLWRLLSFYDFAECFNDTFLVH